MKFTNRSLSLALASMTLLTVYIAFSIGGDSDLRAIFVIISGGFGLCAFMAYIEHRGELKLK